MEATFTVNGKDLDSYSEEEQREMLTRMLIKAVHAVGYEFVNPPKELYKEHDK